MKLFLNESQSIKLMCLGVCFSNFARLSLFIFFYCLDLVFQEKRKQNLNIFQNFYKTTRRLHLVIIHHIFVWSVVSPAVRETSLLTFVKIRVICLLLVFHYENTVWTWLTTVEVELLVNMLAVGHNTSLDSVFMVPFIISACQSCCHFIH